MKKGRQDRIAETLTKAIVPATAFSLPGKWQRSYAIWENPRNLIKKTKSSILLFYKQISLQPQIKKNKPTWIILPSFKTFTAS